jgi:hypothetical protein
MSFGKLGAMGRGMGHLGALGSASNVRIPTGFDWTPPFSIFRGASRTFTTNFSATSLKPAAGTVMYVGPSGSNANNGLSPAARKRSIGACYTAGADTVYCAAGDYTRSNGFEGITLARNFSVIAESAGVYIGRWEPPTSLTWVQDGTFANVWTATRSSSLWVFDRSIVDADGLIQRLALQTSIANCSANPGSFFISGSSVSVCTSDERQPDSNILISLTTANVQLAVGFAGKTLYMEGVELWMGDNPFVTTGLSTSDGTTVVFNGCSFKYGGSSSSGNGASFSNLSYAYLVNCIAAGNRLDGFNYHYAGGGTGHGVEIGCQAFANGWAAGSQNGSTAHEDGRIIRVGCTYSGNVGPQVADINTVQSWNLGVTTDGGATNYETLNTAQMWLDTCTSTGATTDISIGAGSTVYTYQFVGGGVYSGTPTAYTG